jgi:ABC-type dipeptide/oligopeptide/nickel transport system permease subunit
LLSEGAQAINPLKIYWWLLFFPAATMSATLLALNYLGDRLRDTLDPRR